MTNLLLGVVSGPAPSAAAHAFGSRQVLRAAQYTSFQSNAECGMMNDELKTIAFNSSFRIPHSALLFGLTALAVAHYHRRGRGKPARNVFSRLGVAALGKAEPLRHFKMPW
ncbi:MAG TPA: hypothetical protein VGC87_25500 [Pyrinomonadaceae bacterium]|jgi:hypothetical protein